MLFHRENVLQTNFSPTYTNMTEQEWKSPEPALNTVPLRHLLSTVPHQLLNGAEVTRTPGRSVATVAKIGSSQALQTLKRATRIVAVARNASDVLVKKRRPEQEIGYVSNSGAHSFSRGDERESGSSTDEALLGGDESSVRLGAPSETPIIAESKTRVLRENERQPWVVTEQFYAHLATAAARLDTKKTSEKG